MAPPQKPGWTVGLDDGKLRRWFATPPTPRREPHPYPRWAQFPPGSFHPQRHPIKPRKARRRRCVILDPRGCYFRLSVRNARFLMAVHNTSPSPPGRRGRPRRLDAVELRRHSRPTRRRRAPSPGARAVTAGSAGLRKLMADSWNSRRHLPSSRLAARLRMLAERTRLTHSRPAMCPAYSGDAPSVCGG